VNSSFYAAVVALDALYPKRYLPIDLTPHNQTDFPPVGSDTFGADRKMFSRSSQNTTVFHIPLRQLAVHPSQSLSTDLVLSSENLEDIEKGLPNSDDPFDTFNLRECLMSSNEANKAAGIQPKHVGVTWEDLQVMVEGSIDHKVRSCFFWESHGFSLSNHLSNRHTSRHLIASSLDCSWATPDSLFDSFSLHAPEWS
jgi:hypothetical protein